MKATVHLRNSISGAEILSVRKMISAVCRDKEDIKSLAQGNRVLGYLEPPRT